MDKIYVIKTGCTPAEAISKRAALQNLIPECDFNIIFDSVKNCTSTLYMELNEAKIISKK